MPPMAERERVVASGHNVKLSSSGVLFFEFDKAEGVERERVGVDFVIQMGILCCDGDSCAARNFCTVNEGMVLNDLSRHSD